MDRIELQQRTRQFHIDVIRLCKQMPKNAAGFEIAKQLLRSAGSVAANYRASGRAKSKADFVYKMQVVLEEADESHYWLGVVKEAELLTGVEVDALIKEANELTAIFSASVKTAITKDRRETSISRPKGVNAETNYPAKDNAGIDLRSKDQ